MADDRPVLSRMGSTVLFLEEAEVIRKMGFEDEVEIVAALRQAAGEIDHAVAILAKKEKTQETKGKRKREAKDDDEDYDDDEKELIEEDMELDEAEEKLSKRRRGKKSGSKKSAKRVKRETKKGGAKAGKMEAAKIKIKKSRKTPEGEPLTGMVICVSGQMSVVRRQFHQELKEAGAVIVTSVTRKTTHLVTTESEVENPTRKVMSAHKHGTFVVSEDFIRKCIEKDKWVDEDEFVLCQEGKGDEGVNFIEGIKKESKLAVRIKDEGWAVKASTSLLLAEKWRESINPQGWWLSEKLDGVRAFWSGKAFYSRQGNQFPAPDWYKAKLPKTQLDGELWCGRRMFRRSLSIVRNPCSGKLWEYVSYLVFDAPDVNKTFEERMRHVQAVTEGNDVCAAVGMVECKGQKHLLDQLKEVRSKGGEGLMLRKPKSKYVRCRSDVLLKVKLFTDEEAKVTGYQEGKGKYDGRVGALILRTPDGREFKCGSGMRDKDRDNPPKIGDVVTYRYPELMNNGFPRHPVFVGPRPEFNWEEYKTSYRGPKKFKPMLKKQHSVLFGEQLPPTTLEAKIEGGKLTEGGGVLLGGGGMTPVGRRGGGVDVDDIQEEEDLEDMKALEKLYLPPELLTEEGVMAMKLMELKATLRSLMLPVIGTRDVLRKRLINQARREAERGGKNWDQKKVMEWLQNAAEKYGLKATTLVIISLQDLDGPGFLSLTCSEIKEIGVTPLGQVKNVERAVEALKEKLSF